MSDSILLDRIPGPLSLPSIVFGGAVFSHFYNNDEYTTGDGPVATVRAALRAGINAFDTSVYYGDSEVVLGNAFKQLKEEFPRESYIILTKCGRHHSHFDYSAANIRRSVLQSLARFNTDYLDVVYLHDVEFVATNVTPRKEGIHIGALSDEAKDYGLDPDSIGKVQGSGDEAIVEAWKELQKLKEEGKVRHIGITGYPLPTLLRVSLFLEPTPDVVMSYSHLNLQNRSLLSFLPAFREKVGLRTILSASPLNMGLLTPSIPKWHPAPEGLQTTVLEFQTKWDGKLPDLALNFGMEKCWKNELPLVVGLSNVKEVDTMVELWKRFKERGSEMNVEERTAEGRLKGALDEGGWCNWSWASGST